jgi:hypothetical protein
VKIILTDPLLTFLNKYTQNTFSYVLTQDSLPSDVFVHKTCSLLANSCPQRYSLCRNLHSGHESDRQHQANFHALFHTSYVKCGESAEFTTQRYSPPHSCTGHSIRNAATWLASNTNNRGRNMIVWQI